MQSRHAKQEDAQRRRPRAIHRHRTVVPAFHQSKLFSTPKARNMSPSTGAYWLLDEIALIQPYDKNVAAEEFQVWKLTVRPDKTATLTCDDGNGNVVFSKEIPYTDFPLETITLYFANNVIHLPSEY
jgi:hypothetical protein